MREAKIGPTQYPMRPRRSRGQTTRRCAASDARRTPVAAVRERRRRSRADRPATRSHARPTPARSPDYLVKLCQLAAANACAVVVACATPATIAATFNAS
ncbi:hypothetical protein I552_6399 [Mycobacterium xenopi 3993]|nr:hypothetical protein I552_6399 [Mycobacterium xenopi 3993]